MCCASAQCDVHGTCSAHVPEIVSGLSFCVVCLTKFAMVRVLSPTESMPFASMQLALRENWTSSRQETLILCGRPRHRHSRCLESLYLSKSFLSLSYLALFLVAWVCRIAANDGLGIVTCIVRLPILAECWSCPSFIQLVGGTYPRLSSLSKSCAAYGACVAKLQMHNRRSFRVLQSRMIVRRSMVAATVN